MLARLPGEGDASGVYRAAVASDRAVSIAVIVTAELVRAAAPGASGLSVALIGAVIAASPLQGPRWLTVAAYASFGARGASPLMAMADRVPLPGLLLVLAGGAVYRAGHRLFRRSGEVLDAQLAAALDMATDAV